MILMEKVMVIVGLFRHLANRMSRNQRCIIFCLLLFFFINVGSYGMAQTSESKERDPLIENLIRKGVLTEQEADEIERQAGERQEQRQEKLVQEIQDKELAVPEALKGLEVGMLAYIDFSSGQEPEPDHRESNFNKFHLTRGYLIVKKQLLPWMHVRITPDIHQDAEGDWKLRLKYLYTELRPPDFGPLTSMKSELGMGHIPWLDFEEHVNPYRDQGTMAIERAGVFNSADLGISLRGDFAGKLEDAGEKTGSHHYDGSYGTWHIGVYNGPGYHAKEKNKNKIVDGRLTVRPLPDLIPGLQLSYFGLYGEGNEKAGGGYPDYVVNLGMLSYQNPWLIFTSQYFQTEGNQKGTWVDARGASLDTAGYSFFANVKLPILERKLSLFGRYDHFDQDVDDKIADDTDYHMFIGGLAYDFYKGNMLLLAYETTDYGRDAGEKTDPPRADNKLGDDYRIQAVWQIKF